jgi:heme/copper-type cytochrome/quinol oxidase subunit 2
MRTKPVPLRPVPVAFIVTSPVPESTPVELIDILVPAIILVMTAEPEVDVFKSALRTSPSSICRPRRPVTGIGMSN